MIPRRTLLVAGALLLVAACASRTGVDDPLPSALEGTPAAADTIEPSAVTPTAPPVTEPVRSDAPTAVGQTDTDWGRIWDAVPAGFPVYPGAVETDVGEPVSAAFTTGDAGPDEIATWLQQDLELATYSTEALSGPLEDGGFVIDSVGDGACRIQTTIAPAGAITLITVRYGADCPFE